MDHRQQGFDSLVKSAQDMMTKLERNYPQSEHQALLATCRKSVTEFANAARPQNESERRQLENQHAKVIMAISATASALRRTKAR